MHSQDLLTKGKQFLFIIVITKNVKSYFHSNDKSFISARSLHFIVMGVLDPLGLRIFKRVLQIICLTCVKVSTNR